MLFVFWYYVCEKNCNFFKKKDICVREYIQEREYKNTCCKRDFEADFERAREGRKKTDKSARILGQLDCASIAKFDQIKRQKWQNYSPVSLSQIGDARKRKLNTMWLSVHFWWMEQVAFVNLQSVSHNCDLLQSESAARFWISWQRNLSVFSCCIFVYLFPSDNRFI